jgi:hypothetical protein
MTRTESRARPSRSRRIAASAALALLALVVAALAWNATSLRGLPDIGDPFDVKAFIGPQVRDEDNAFVLYRQADAMYRRWDGQPSFAWASASEGERRWLEENREALASWRRGTDRPDSLFIPPEQLTFDADTGVLQRARTLARLACLEASRLEAEGDFAGAWSWYRAVLRCSRHFGHRGCLIERLIGIALHGHACGRITSWASQPEVDARLLRTALDEVQAIDAMTAPMSDALKCEYLAFLKAMEQPGVIWRLLESISRDPNAPTRTNGEFLKTALLRGETFLKHEPERSRRVLRLVTANWLAFADLSNDRRPPLEPRKKLVYIPDPDAAAETSILPPDRLVSWFDSTVFCRALFPALDAARNAISRERATQAKLIIHLATELYRREHGKPPTAPDDLVGPYLKALPTMGGP